MTTNDIVTNRLILRSTREQDGPFCISIWLDNEMGKYLRDPPKEKAGEGYLNFAKSIEAQQGWYPFVALSKDTGEFIGTCSCVPDKNDCWDLGYCVHKKFWRQGYATEMITSLIEFGYSNGYRKFTAKVAQENTASNAVLKKLGFSVISEGSFKKQSTDIIYPEYTYMLNKE